MMDRHSYRIVVAGRMGTLSTDAFTPYAVEVDGAVSVITARDVDQSALFGLLRRVESLALQLVEVKRDPS